ncbi:MAG TPA: FliH/SctL family protein [Pirellulaceae bacterium]|nr:FliH/SctL family protein [Pirellulaceae bacterium]
MAAILKSSDARTMARATTFGAGANSSAAASGAVATPLAEVNELAAETRRICEQARREAAETLARARAEADEIRRAAEADGRRAAREEAQLELQRAVEAQLNDAPAAWRQLVDEIERSRQQWLARWQHDAVSLACEIAARVIRSELRQRPELTLGLVREALELAAGRPRVVLALHPRDLELLSGQLGQLLAEMGRVATVEVAADSRLEPGGCRVTSEFGELDQQWTTRLARIEAELL